MIRTRFLSVDFVSGLPGKVRCAALAVTAMAIVTFCPAPASATLTHWWAFEEPNGMGPPQVLDSVGTNHGTFVNMTDANRSFDFPPAYFGGKSLQFDGVDEKVTLASQIGLPNNTNFSVAFWYRGTEPADTSTDWGSTIIGRNNNDVYANITLRGGKVEYLHHNAGWQHNIVSTTTVTDNQWHHVAVVNRSTGFADLYVDGVMQAFNQSSATDGGPAFPLRIDGFMSGFNTNPPLSQGLPLTFTQGKLDDVRIYDHALVAAEVQALAQAAVPEPSSGLLLLGGLVLGRRYQKRLRSR